MASSSNRFAVLGGTPSSSKGQKTKVPVTSTGDGEDQTMQDTAQAGTSTSMGDQPMQGTAQAGSSMSTSGSEGSLPGVPNLKEGLALFYKKRAQIKAEDRERERTEKAQGRRNPTTFVRRPNPSAGSSQGRRKRTASSDEAEKPSKRRLMAPVSSVTAEEPSTAASESTPAGSPSTSELVVQGDSVLSPWRAGIRIPEKALPCIIQVNCLARWGTFDETVREWTFLLTFDVEHQRGPAMTMKFFSSGVTGQQSAQTGWRLSDYMEDEWMVLDFSIHRVSGSSNRRICHRRILEACQTDEEKARCICIRLEAWPKLLGHFDDRAEEDFAAIFTGRHPYQLHIWFLAPDDVETFEKQCLSFFTHFFEHRDSVHSRIPKR